MDTTAAAGQGQGTWEASWQLDVIKIKSQTNYYWTWMWSLASYSLHFSLSHCLWLYLFLWISLYLLLTVSLSLFIPVCSVCLSWLAGILASALMSLVKVEDGLKALASSLKTRSRIVNHIYNVWTQLPCKYGSATYVITLNKPTTATTTIIYAYTHTYKDLCVYVSRHKMASAAVAVASSNH